MVINSGSEVECEKFLFLPEAPFSIFRKLGGGDFRLIYRHYATLYFVFCVDSSESELGILDLIQVCEFHLTKHDTPRTATNAGVR